MNHGVADLCADVQLTKDHVPVIYHDFLVSETGIDAPVHTLTLEQVALPKPLISLYSSLKLTRFESFSTSATAVDLEDLRPLHHLRPLTQ